MVPHMETTALLILVSSLAAAVLQAHELEKRQAINVQNPPAWQALDQLRGSIPLTAADVQSLMASAVPGVTYPTLAYIPQTGFTCSNVRQPGYYADLETRCQVYHRCENNYIYSFLCPNTTIFNQIALVCDHWYNVQCENNAQFVDYSNPRIGIQNARLLDDGGDYSQGGQNGPLSAAYTAGQPQQPQLGLQQRPLQVPPAPQQQVPQGPPQSPQIYPSTGLQQSNRPGPTTLYGSGLQSANYGPASVANAGGMTTYSGNGPSAYSGVFAGAYTPSVSQPNRPLSAAQQYPSSLPFPTQQLQYGPQPNYPQQGVYNQQLRMAYGGQNQNQPAIPSYRSVQNRLLRMQADASEKVNDVVSTKSPLTVTNSEVIG